jgi:hypothetical protein
MESNDDCLYHRFAEVGQGATHSATADGTDFTWFVADSFFKGCEGLGLMRSVPPAIEVDLFRDNPGAEIYSDASNG